MYVLCDSMHTHMLCTGVHLRWESWWWGACRAWTPRSYPSWDTRLHQTHPTVSTGAKVNYTCKVCMPKVLVFALPASNVAVSISACTVKLVLPATACTYMYENLKLQSPFCTYSWNDMYTEKQQWPLSFVNPVLLLIDLSVPLFTFCLSFEG